MTNIVYRSDTGAGPRSRIAHQFTDKPNFLALLDGLTEELQEVEDTLFSMLDLHQIETAVTGTLEAIGNILNEPRDGQSDADYKLSLAFKIFTNTSGGTISDIVTATKVLTAGTQVEISETFPAAVELTTDGINVDAATEARLQKLVAATVELTLISTLGEDAFVFFDDPDGEGFNDTGSVPDDGGVLVDTLSFLFET